jgi:hypothetical protein
MYRLNELKRPVLITVDEVLARSAMIGDPQVRMILQNIEIAEERFITNALGSKFYEDFIEKKNVVVTPSNQDTLLTAVNADRANEGKEPLTDLPIGTYINAIELVTDVNYVALWGRYLWRLTAECVDLMCTVPSWLQHTAQGQQMNKPAIIGSSGESASGTAKDIKFKMDVQMQERIDPLRARMDEWICRKKSEDTAAFPLYEKCPCSGDSLDGISTLRKTAFIFGGYDDHDCNPCKGW